MSDPVKCSGKWIVCQIGAREHYAIPRALHQAGKLAALVTDLWCPPESFLSKLPIGARARGRWHPDLETAPVYANNLKTLAFEAWARARRLKGWPLAAARNHFFQKQAIRLLKSHKSKTAEVKHLFSYSYSANELFQFARDSKWTAILGQIDPGPEEQRIVLNERARYPSLGSRWQPAPDKYWDSWHREIELADGVIINSEWSRTCLLKEGINTEKLVTIPLVYERSKAKSTELPDPPAAHFSSETSQDGHRRKLKVLFLGQINLRKGIARLLEAMRILKSEPIELTLAGPSEFSPAVWADLPNVRWVGPVPRSEVARYYQAADLFILPTLSDGYAITQLEALAYGLPIMRSIHCGDPFVSGNKDLQLESLEPAGIAAALLRVYQSPQILDQQTTPLTFTMHDLAEKIDETANFKRNCQ